MKTKSVLFAVAFLLLNGCSMTHVVKESDVSTWGPTVVEQLEGKDVQLVLRNGTRMEGQILSLDGTRVVQRNPSFGMDRSIPIDSVLQIDSGSNAGSVVLGILGGGLVGGLIGAAIGMTEGPAVPEDVTGITTAFSMAGAGAVGAIVGGVLGGMIVGLSTKTHDYVIVHTQGQPK